MAASAGFCRPNDQAPLSPEAYQQARGLCEQIRSLIAARPDFLRRTRRASEIHLPHGNGLHDAYQAAADGDYSVVNNLRRFLQDFTGHTPLSDAAGPSPDVDAYMEMTAHLPEVLHISASNVLGEVGWVVNGKIVNHDTNLHLEQVALLAASGKLWELRNRTPEWSAARGRPWQRPRVLEIGPGYGGLAHHLRTLLPHARFVLVDAPEALLFAAIYLSILWPDADNVLITPDNLAALGKDTPGFTFVPNFLFDDLCATGMEIDLVLNALTMSDMTEKQVRYYCKGVSRLLGRRGVFFEQNRDDGPADGPCVQTVLANFFRLGLSLRSPVVAAAHRPAHLWADWPVKPFAWLPTSEAVKPGAATAYTAPSKDQAVLVEEDFCGVNVIYYCGAWYGLPQGCGPFDPRRVQNKGYRELFTAPTKGELKRAIHAVLGTAAG